MDVPVLKPITTDGRLLLLLLEDITRKSKRTLVVYREVAADPNAIVAYFGVDCLV